jgi:legumain
MLFPLIFSVIVCVKSSDFWALLVAGSRGIGNYRHQADVCHTYSLFTEGAVPEAKIVVMMYDDVAWSNFNPLLGRLYNEPDGRNVYDSCKVDFLKDDVNLVTFSRVLTGMNSETDIVDGLGSVRQSSYAFRNMKLPLNKQAPAIASTSNSTVFVSFVDHGTPGELLFPIGGLSGPSLLAIIQHMEFQRLIIYVEACFAGSVFENIQLPKNVIAITASNSTESSWGTFCPTPRHPDADTVNGVHIGTCLGDLFEVTWKRDLELRLSTGTFGQARFKDHVDAVTAIVSKKSNVMIYGDSELLSLPLNEVFPLHEFTTNGRKLFSAVESIIETSQINNLSLQTAGFPWIARFDHTLIAT